MGAKVIDKGVLMQEEAIVQNIKCLKKCFQINEFFGISSVTFGTDPVFQ